MFKRLFLASALVLGLVGIGHAEDNSKTPRMPITPKSIQMPVVCMDSHDLAKTFTDRGYSIFSSGMVNGNQMVITFVQKTDRNFVVVLVVPVGDGSYAACILAEGAHFVQREELNIEEPKKE